MHCSSISKSTIRERNMKNTILTVAACLTLFRVTASGANAPKKIFGFENDKRIGNFALLQDDSIIAIRERTRLWGYDSATGEKKWELKVKGGIDEGRHLIWNDKLYLMPLKKGMAAFDVNTGKQVWESKFDIKMQGFRDSYSYTDNFLLEFEDDLISLNPETGEVVWKSEKMEYSKAAGKADAQRFYYLTKDWGSRILILGKKGPVLMDAKTGKTLWQSVHDFSDEIEKPVLFTSDSKDAAVILYEEGASSVNLKTGEEAWFIKDEFEDATGLVQFENKGGKYCMFAFGKKLVMFDAVSGKILWETARDSEFKGRPYTVRGDGDDMLVVSARNSGGGYLTLYRIAFDTGAIKWKRDIASSKLPHVNFKIPILGIRVRNNSVWYRQPVETPKGWLFQVWGNDTRKLDNKNAIGEKEGEGLIMINPATGDVVWRSYFSVMKDIKKDTTKMQDGMMKAGIFGKARNIHAPDDKIYPEMLPEPVIAEDGIYAYGNDSLLKLNMETGAVIWSSQPYGYLSKIIPFGKEVYCVQGSAQWTYTADAKKEKAEDIIIQSRKQGFFAVEAATGKQIWLIDSSKKPYSIFTPLVDKSNASLYVTDGRYLRRLDLKPDTKGFVWEIDLKKSKIGEIGAEAGVVFKMTSKTFSGGGSYSTITKTYSVGMEHGVWQLANGDLLAIAEEGPARIGQDGKFKWQLEWEWKRNKIRFTPMRIQNDKYIIYQYKNKLYCVDLETGNVKWMTKESKDADIMFDTKEQRMFIVGDDEVTAYEI